MMFAKGSAFGACVVSAALLVAGCSSEGAKQSAPTTASTTTTTSLVRGTGIADGAGPVGPPGNSHVVAELGPCPKHDPKLDLVKANAGVLGLHKRLVPVPATSVRVCAYLYSDNDTTTRLPS